MVKVKENVLIVLTNPPHFTFLLYTLTPHYIQGSQLLASLNIDSG